MQIPNAERARVDRSKIVEYLLCETHPDGAAKARFFAQFGFCSADWEVLAESLRKHGQTCPVIGVMESAYGTRYTVKGPLETPDGRRLNVVTVWIVEEGAEVPRLVTAFPRPRS